MSLLDLNNNTSLVSVISSLFALWLFIYFFYPQEEEEEENGKEKEESGAVKVEQEAVVAAVEGFDTKAFLMLLRDADVRVSTDEEPLLLHLTLNLNDELTYRAESGLLNYKHPKGPLKSLKTVRLQGDLIKLEFQDKVMPMVFRCQRSQEIADGLASVVSALASNPFLLKKEQDSPVSFIMSPPV